MKKQYYILFGLCVASFSAFSQQMVEKKVCNTLENGAEFCTIFKVPASQEKKKTVEEINKELEKESEIVFKEKDEKKAFVPINNESNANVKKQLVPPSVKLDKKEDKPQKEEKVSAKDKKQVKKINKKRTKEFKPKKIAPAVVSPISESKNEAIVENTKKVEPSANIKNEVIPDGSKKEDIVSNANQKLVADSLEKKQDEANAKRKPTLKEKKSFSDLLNTIKDLD